MKNRLAGETSPYLLQHADNPVDWYPWEEEAFKQAREQDKPILLSVGYAACHWCHVMAHESFEDPDTAAVMNEHFVNIKVDREERPDVDSIYMNAVVALNGQGGWPMTVFLTPSGEPFYGGTYYPPVARHGLPSFKQLLQSISQAWQEKRSDIVDSASSIATHLAESVTTTSQPNDLSDSILEQATGNLIRQFDQHHGGFGSAPKFPQPMIIEFLLRRYVGAGDDNALWMSDKTLKEMARGGMYDQIGGGFARYSTDRHWLVPHFEKMLYDNALLSRAYLHAWRITANPLYKRIVVETLDWALTEMLDRQGGFYSSLDADSEGEEGKFYVWTLDELTEILGEDADLAKLYYGVSKSGNWEGTNILHVARTIEEIAESTGEQPENIRDRLVDGRNRLYKARDQRIRPGLDNKVITSWNGLMLAALAEAGRDLNEPRYLAAAVSNAEFIYASLRDERGRLKRTWSSDGGAKNNAYLDDYAFLIEGLIALYQATFDERWYQWAIELADIIVTYFEDDGNVGFFDTSSDHESLIMRPKGLQDNAIPSGNSAAAMGLLQLSLYSGSMDYRGKAELAVASMNRYMTQHPTGFAHWLCAADLLLGKPKEVAIIGSAKEENTREMLNTVFCEYRPNLVVALGSGDNGIPLLEKRGQIDGMATAYVCQNFSCELPVTEAHKLAEQLR